MKDIFAELYNKVLSFFNKTDEQNKENAKDVACNRLKLVLMQDRTNLSPAIMDRMRKELVELLSKYMELDRELLDLNFEHEDEQMALMLSIPVIRAKSEEEIQAILDKEDEELNKEEDEEDVTEDDSEVSEDESDDSSDEEKEESVEVDSETEEKSEENTSEEDDSEETSDDEDDSDEDDDDVEKEDKKEEFFSSKKSKSKSKSSKEND